MLFSKDLLTAESQQSGLLLALLELHLHNLELECNV
jgi:hypothetical protein